MKKIEVKPRFPVDPSTVNPKDIVFPTLSFLIDETHAIQTDAFTVDLVSVLPDETDPGTYLPVQGSYITIAVDDARTIAGLEQIVEKLHMLTAYQLLTEHFSLQDSAFYVNRNRSFSISEITEDVKPANEHNPPEGCDY